MSRRLDSSFRSEAHSARWLALYATLVFAFLYLPIVVLIVYSFNGQGVGGFPPRDFTLNWYRLLFQDEAIWASVLNSFVVALASVVIALTLGIPAGLALVGVKREHFGRLVEVAVADICHQTNPRPCTREDLLALYREAW